MPRIEGIRICNYRSLQDVTLGRLMGKKGTPLTSLTTIIGKNGVGKSSVLDAIGFLSDCLESGVSEACNKRGGFSELRTRDAKHLAIEFTVYVSANVADPNPKEYELRINARSGIPVIVFEQMSQIDQFGTNKNVIKKWIMSRSDGKGKVNNYFESKEDRDNDVSGRRKKGLPPQPYITDFNLEDTDKTGIATIGFLSEHPRIVEFRRFMASWFLCDFSPHLVKTQYSADPEVHLSSSGDNLGNYVLFLEKKYPERIKSILKKLSTKIPGVKKIQTRRTINGQLLLQFHSTYFKQPFYPQQMSDGTLRLFAYLLLLEDPKPASVLCIDEPENALHHKLIEVLATELRDHADARKNQTQVFVATQEPYFVNALSPQEVWILEKGNDGYTTARRASDDPLVNNFVAEGLQLGSLWYSGYLDAR